MARYHRDEDGRVHVRGDPVPRTEVRLGEGLRPQGAPEHPPGSEQGRGSYSRCERCGYSAFDGQRCWDCGYVAVRPCAHGPDAARCLTCAFVRYQQATLRVLLLAIFNPRRRR